MEVMRPEIDARAAILLRVSVSPCPEPKNRTTSMRDGVPLRPTGGRVGIVAVRL